MKIELVVWHDAVAGDAQEGWSSPEDIEEEEYIVTSVGWVIKETEANLTLSMDCAADGQTHTRGRIPKGMIVSRKVLHGL